MSESSLRNGLCGLIDDVAVTVHYGKWQMVNYCRLSMMQLKLPLALLICACYRGVLYAKRACSAYS